MKIRYFINTTLGGDQWFGYLYHKVIYNEETGEVVKCYCVYEDGKVRLPINEIRSPINEGIEFFENTDWFREIFEEEVVLML